MAGQLAGLPAFIVSWRKPVVRSFARSPACILSSWPAASRALQHLISFSCPSRILLQLSLPPRSSSDSPGQSSEPACWLTDWLTTFASLLVLTLPTTCILQPDLEQLSHLQDGKQAFWTNTCIKWLENLVKREKARKKKRIQLVAISVNGVKYYQRTSKKEHLKRLLSNNQLIS